jgi:hypothetical protein
MTAAAVRARRRPANRPPRLEPLEERTLPVAVPLTNHEQFFLELLNRARADPAAEAARYGIDLTEGPVVISPAPKQPLAPNAALLTAMRAHLDDMLANHFFDHYGSDGSSPFTRMTAAGYTPYTTLGENIAWQGTTGTPDVTQYVADMHRALFVDAGYPGRGHRVNMMNPAFKEVGAGVDQGPYHPPPSTLTYNAVLSGHDLGARPGNSFLTGVVFNDSLVLANDFYTPGEGLGGITVTAVASGGGAYTEVTGAAGGYRLQVPSGTYTVSATGSGLPGILVRTGVFVGAENVKVDFSVTAPPPPPLLSLLADFGPGGLWGWSDAGGSWRLLSGYNPTETDLDANGDAFVSFGLLGLWRHTRAGSWQHLSAAAPEQSATAGGELFGDFGGSGLWRWQAAGGWQQLTALNPDGFVVTPSRTVFGDFGAGGLWRWAPAGGWQLLTGWDAQQVTAAPGSGQLYADFGPSGLWRWTSSAGWRLLTTLDAEAIHASDAGFLYGDFGGLGLWLSPEPGVWQQLTALNPTEIDVAPDAPPYPGDLYASFGAAGLWRRSGVTGIWTLLAGQGPGQSAVASDGSLFTDYGAGGLWQWSSAGGWALLSPWDAEALTPRR